ncbi:MAG: Flp pilus assembly protein CpaB [Clostridia bacterium]|nr:Flp pilus assembly protein CpaB [Clostridia bacterium]
MRSKLIFLISLILGLVTAYLIYDFLNKTEQSAVNIQYGEVVVAAVDILEKTQINNDMIQVNKLPVEYIHPQAIRNKNEIAGRITTSAIAAGEQLLNQKLAAPGETAYGLAYAIPQGKRALTIAVDTISGIAGLIKPGDEVDVVAVIDLPDPGSSRDLPFSLIALQDIRVLAVGSQMKDTHKSSAPLEYSNITLAVTAEEARPLTLAAERGSIRLMLRSPVDDSKVNTVPFKAEHFRQQHQDANY